MEYRINIYIYYLKNNIFQFINKCGILKNGEKIKYAELHLVD